MQATIYHNPRCSKSRAALALLTQAGADVTIVEYLKTPPTRDELAALLTRADLTPREALRTGETEAKPLKTADDATILDAMAEHPILIERPIVETAKGVVLARPPERVHDIL
ncbi:MULTISPECIES: arsenate reductase (glutaredoxin) [Sphingomonas]|jgi:arsenate reductase|uniref:Arsenate reductase n=1 Tax=Sphingomonas hankookensis TaxID=563996 RepID=A0ABR5YEU5_9SPHN|nr:MULTISPECIES: arsenate reductase (glutaredoxin) [Sphingomonas]KZE17775.1 arsenate reductase [Sphingomonas hankookensis]PZT95904.1 MAG: arsenate reductase (glutaredoxin) [Sphingomonas sp.]RSV25022.1 arsenate reductase (glutaredoxin) [Sphingomonas sp. ABOLH]WCP73576.1 arsenate reductase (glutaredoxin) [Sphingomonas hankookensis]